MKATKDNAELKAETSTSLEYHQTDLRSRIQRVKHRRAHPVGRVKGGGSWGGIEGENRGE